MSNSIKRFFITWIITSLVMFSISYAWHGIFLNDFSRLTYPKEIFFIFSSIVYLVIGFVVVKVIDSKILERFFHRKLFLEGLIKGMFCGFIFFLIATVIGVSFNPVSGIKNLLFDMGWQIVEQGIGGCTVAIMYMVIGFSFVENN